MTGRERELEKVSKRKITQERWGDRKRNRVSKKE